MTKNKTWKRAASAALSLALVTGMLPANVEGFLTRSMGTVGIVASAAAPEAITDQTTLTPTATTASGSELGKLLISPMPDRVNEPAAQLGSFSQKAVGSLGTAYDRFIRYSSEEEDVNIITYLWIDRDRAQSLTFTDKQGRVLDLEKFESSTDPYYYVSHYDGGEAGTSAATDVIFYHGYYKVPADDVNIYYNEQDTIEWSADSFPTVNGSYKLMKDITLATETEVKNGDITFDLNGHNILVKTGGWDGSIYSSAPASSANMYLKAGIYANNSSITITNSAEATGFIYAEGEPFESYQDRFSRESQLRFRRFIHVENINGNSKLTISGREGTQNIVVTGFNSSAVYSRNGTVNVSNTVFANNDGLNGAALYIETRENMTDINHSLTATNCLFQGNSANEYGGAVYFRGAKANISDCTFTGNRANMCGALYFGSCSNSSSSSNVNTVTMKDTVVTNNTANRFGAIANVPVETGFFTEGNSDARGSYVNYVMVGDVVISGNQDKLSVNENTDDALLEGGDLYLYYDPDEDNHASEWNAINVHGGDAYGSWTTTMDISGLTGGSNISYRLFKSTNSGIGVMLMLGVLTDELSDPAKANINLLSPSYQTPEGESYIYAQKINADGKLEVYKKTYTVSNNLYFTNALTDLTKTAAENAAKSTFNNIDYVTKYTDDVKLSDTIYAELADDDDENSVVQIASVSANNKVYDGKPYNPELSVKKECYAGFSFDVPEYYQIVTEEDGTKKVVYLGTVAPKEKGSYLVSYSVLRWGTAIRNKYLYAPFTIGAQAITDYVVTADLNHDQKISADEFFGGVKRPEAPNTLTAEVYFNGGTDVTAEDVISKIKNNSEYSYKFAPLDDLLKLYYTGEPYELNVYPFSVYQNEEGTWEVVQLTETIDEVKGDFTVEDNMKSEVGDYTIKVTAPEYVGTKEIPWKINKNKVTDYLVAVDVNHDERITADELFGTLRQDPTNENIENAYTLAGSADLSNILAQDLINALAIAETGNDSSFNPFDQFYQKNVKFNDLADLKYVLEYDGKPYELKVQPFSVMEGRNGYSTVLLDADALNIGGTPSKVVAGQYVLEAQSSNYDIAIRAEQGSELPPTNTIRVPWAINANESRAKFGTVLEVDRHYSANDSEEVTVQYTGKPAVIPTFWAEKPDSNYDWTAVYFFVDAENTNLPVNFYHYDNAKSMWVEGMPTAVGNYQVAAVYNGTMDAKGEVKQVNRNVKASSDTINLTIEPAKVDANVHAESEYGSKLADIKDIKLQSDLTVDGKEISEMVDVTAKLADAGTKGLVLNAGSYDVELTINPKKGYEDVLKNFDFGTDDSGKVIVRGAYTVTKKEITEDMVSFTSKYVKPREDGMVNPGDMTVKFDGYDAAGNAQEIVLKNGTDYKTYGATQASGEATYEMDLVGVGNNYTGVATVSWVVDTRSEVEITGKYAEVKSVSYNADTKKLKFNARMTIPDDAVMTKIGIIATSNASIKYNLTLDTAPETGVTFVKATTTGLDGLKGTNYTWTKTAVGPDDVWYAVPYVCYELNGETVTKYGALVEATAEGVTPVELATAEYVSAEYANEKLKFNTLVSIPDGCTMDAIGVCATSNAETAENLTIDTPAVTGVTYIKKVDTGLEGITKTGYHWTKSAVKEGTTWFVKPYVTYTDADGVQQTIYGDLEPVKAESEKV